MIAIGCVFQHSFFASFASVVSLVKNLRRPPSSSFVILRFARPLSPHQPHGLADSPGRGHVLEFLPRLVCDGPRVVGQRSGRKTLCPSLHRAVVNSARVLCRRALVDRLLLLRLCVPIRNAGSRRCRLCGRPSRPVLLDANRSGPFSVRSPHPRCCGRCGCVSHDPRPFLPIRVPAVRLLFDVGTVVPARLA